MIEKTSNPKHLSLAAFAAFAALVALTVLVGCSSENNSTDDAKPLSSLTPTQEAQKERAIAAKDKLFTALLGELTESMAENGPAKSISVCKTRAPAIAQAVGEETGVRIGRTSFKLRNKNNAAPPWAASFVKQKIEKPVEVSLVDDELGVLLPIRLQATCTLCHGAKGQLMPDVLAAIDSNYPNDEATGFAEGDIRGYFWIEVPN